MANLTVLSNDSKGGSIIPTMMPSQYIHSTKKTFKWGQKNLLAIKAPEDTISTWDELIPEIIEDNEIPNMGRDTRAATTRNIRYLMTEHDIQLREMK